MLFLLATSAHATHFRFQNYEWTSQFSAAHHGRDTNYHLRASQEIESEGGRARATYACNVRSDDFDCRVSVVSIELGECDGGVGEYASGACTVTESYRLEFSFAGDSCLLPSQGPTFAAWLKGDVDAAAEAAMEAGGAPLHGLVLDDGVAAILEYVAR